MLTIKLQFGDNTKILGILMSRINVNLKICYKDIAIRLKCVRQSVKACKPLVCKLGTFLYVIYMLSRGINACNELLRLITISNQCDDQSKTHFESAVPRHLYNIYSNQHWSTNQPIVRRSANTLSILMLLCNYGVSLVQVKHVIRFSFCNL